MSTHPAIQFLATEERLRRERARAARRSAVIRCQWYALCALPAAGTVAHPVLGDVPTCSRCAEKHDLTLTAY